MMKRIFVISAFLLLFFIPILSYHNLSDTHNKSMNMQGKLQQQNIADNRVCSLVIGKYLLICQYTYFV